MDRAPLLPPPDEDLDQVVVMRGVDWTVYETLLTARGEKPQPRLAYLDGNLEIMTTSRRHEIIKKMLARLAEQYALECGGDFDATGQETLKHPSLEAGAEPDEAYFVGPMRKFPDLVIEVVQTHGGIDKLEIYRRMRVAEVWFWLNDEIRVYRLGAGGYREVTESVALPGIDLVEVAEIAASKHSGQNQAILAYRASLQAKRKPKRSPRRRGS